MNGKRARKHHFVPQTLQRRFLDENGKIWYSEKDDNGVFGGPEARNTSSTFKIRDYYTVIEDGELSDKYETQFYGALDDFLGKFLSEIHDALDRNTVPSLSTEAMTSVKRVLYHLIIRTPEFTKKYDDYEIGKEIFEKTLADAIREDLPQEQIDELRNDLNSSAKVRQHGRTVRVKSQAAGSKKVENALKKFGIRYAISSGKHSFVLSSLAAYRIGNGGHNGLSNPDMEIWLPISPKRSLVFLKDQQNKVPMIVEEPRDHMRVVNEYAVRNAQQVASHSPQLLKSLLRSG